MPLLSNWQPWSCLLRVYQQVLIFPDVCWLHDSWQGKKKRNHFIGFPCWDRKIWRILRYNLGFYAWSDTRKDGIAKGIFTAYKTSLLFYLIEILDGRYPENNICFFHIHSCVWSGRDSLNYKPERMPGPIGSHRSVSTRIARLVYVCIHAVPQRTGRWWTPAQR